MFLITILAKGDKTNLTQGERNELKKMTKTVAARYGREFKRSVRDE